tara:strand:+ start:421 stop:738 length:318 start_codon:yes stop_codon:yes gene_type:complete
MHKIISFRSEAIVNKNCLNNTEKDKLHLKTLCGVSYFCLGIVAYVFHHTSTERSEGRAPYIITISFLSIISLALTIAILRHSKKDNQANTYVTEKSQSKPQVSEV